MQRAIHLFVMFCKEAAVTRSVGKLSDVGSNSVSHIYDILRVTFSA